jgi:4-hydroxybenzoate polyprenyltransferase
MTLMQFAIGAANDVIDATADAGRKPGKPIPSGQVGEGTAIIAAVAAAFAGVALALALDPLVGIVAVLVLGIGLAYDLWFKGTAWSWLPFAVGIPLLPVYGWLGARGDLPSLFAVVVPIACIEGAALAIANALVDIERDRAAGRHSVAAVLGRERSGSILVVLQLAVGIVAVVTAAAIGVDPPWLASVTLGALGLAVGSSWSRLRSASARADAREWAWRLQAVSAAVLAIGWLAGAATA